MAVLETSHSFFSQFFLDGFADSVTNGLGCSETVGLAIPEACLLCRFRNGAEAGIGGNERGLEVATCRVESPLGKQTLSSWFFKWNSRLTPSIELSSIPYDPGTGFAKGRKS